MMTQTLNIKDDGIIDKSDTNSEHVYDEIIDADTIQKIKMIEHLMMTQIRICT